ncbi:M16 family metallopeptidase [Flavitalea flava]
MKIHLTKSLLFLTAVLLCWVVVPVFAQKTVTPPTTGKPVPGKTVSVKPELLKSETLKPETSKPLVLDPAVRTGKLANGFTYFIRRNTEPKNRVFLYLVNKAGSILEEEDQRGLAHFVEHMSFNGTKHFPKNELVNYLQKSGIRFGADLNAYTSFDETVYQLPIPSDKPELLKGGMAIMRDWAQEATLDPEEIDKERGVILEEKRLGKGANERMQKIYWPIILGNSRYAERIPIGLDTVLENFKPEAIRRFYKDWYRPDLQALIIVGDINVDQMEQTVKQQFSSLKNPVGEKARKKYAVPLTGKNQFVAVTDKEMTATVAEVMIKHIAPKLQTTADYRKGVIQNLFNQILGDRYSELARKADPPFIGGSAGISGFIGGLDNFDASVQAKPGELEKGFKAVWRESERVRQFGFTQTELDRAKAALLSGVEVSLKEKDKTNSGNYVNEYQEYFLKGVAAPGIAVEYRLTKDDLAAITLAEINQLTKEYIKPVNRDILILAPEKDKAVLPDEKTVNGWLQEVENETLSPYKDEVSSKPLLGTDPVPGKITGEQGNKELKLTRLTLSNGLVVLIKPTNFKNDEIVFSGFAPGGTSLYKDAEYQSAANAAGIIAAGGAGNYSTNELEKFLQGKQVSVQPFISERYQGINGAAAPKDLETAMKLLYAYFAEPRKDEEVFKGIIARSKAGLANRANDPSSVFNDTVGAVLGSYHIRRTGPTVEKLDQIDLDNAYRIYKESFANAGDFIFTFVGSIDTNTLKPLLEKYLGSLPAIGNHLKAIDLGIHIPAGKIEKNVYKGSEPKSTVLLIYSGNIGYTPANRVGMDALKEVLEIRLLERLREEESGVYSPGAYINMGKYPDSRYSLIVEFGCAPKNVDKLIASVTDEINKLKTTGPPQGNIDKWRAEEKTSTETSLKTNGFWVSYLNEQLQNEEPLDQVNDYFKQLDQVTPAAIKELAAKYLSGDNFIRLVLLPENGK